MAIPISNGRVPGNIERCYLIESTESKYKFIAIKYGDLDIPVPEGCSCSVKDEELCISYFSQYGTKNILPVIPSIVETTFTPDITHKITEIRKTENPEYFI